MTPRRKLGVFLSIDKLIHYDIMMISWRVIMTTQNFEKEKIIKPRSGFLGLFVALLLLAISIVLFIVAGISFDSGKESLFALAVVSLIVAIISLIVAIFLFPGLRVVKPNEAIVLSLFGKYYGTIYQNGFWFVNPFCSNLAPKSKIDDVGKKQEAQMAQVNINFPQSSKISLKVSTFVNGNQKVNDRLGNPIEVSAIVIWKIVNATKAVINFDNYYEYLSNQTDSTIRNISRLYPYDIIDDNDENDDEGEKTLRGSSSLIAEEMKKELSSRVIDAGIEIIDVRLNQIAYAPEIAAAMLQRQQAIAIIAARKKIVEGAVSMVEMALNKLKSEGVVDLDEERKANMVSNLLVVLCSSKETNPIVNAGSLY